MICCGTRPGDWEKIYALSLKHSLFFPCFGLHPWFADEAAGGWLGQLEKFLMKTPSCVGEIGLDRARNASGQEDVFRAQLELAGGLARPAVIHCVKNWSKTLELLKTARLPAFMLHAYGGAPELTKNLAAMGGYFSFGFEIMDPEREKARAALRAAPPDRLLFESESAGSAACLPRIISAAAALTGRTPEAMAELSLTNGNTFLRFAGG